MNITPEERADRIRHLFAEPGWAMHTEHLDEKISTAKDQALLMGEERHPDYKTWSIDRLSGYVLGLGYARKHLAVWLTQYENLEREAQQNKSAVEAFGHPYAEDPMALDNS